MHTRSRRSSTTAALVAAAALTLSACATTVTGTGGSAAVTPTGSGPTGFPSDTASETPTAPPTTMPTSPPATTPTPTPSVSLYSVAPPKTCPPSTCKQVATADAGDGYRVVLLSNPSYNGGMGLSALELIYTGVPVFWATYEGETPNTIACSPQPSRRCVVVNYSGAHSAVGRLWKIEDTQLAAVAEVATASPRLEAVDLNHDGYLDLRGVQNTYEPDYATGRVYWQTWLSDGARLTSTGCGSPAATLPAPPPAPLTGRCL